MKIAITGSSGFIGSAVVATLCQQGHAVTRIVRSREAAEAPDAIYWSPATGEIDAEGLSGHRAVINLAGENIFGIWTPSKKDRIRSSRVEGTRLLAETLAGLEDTRRPQTLVSASAVGYYGDRPEDRPLAEDAPPGGSFMAGVVADWEGSTAPAEAAGIRVVLLRFGLVLDPEGLLLQGVTAATRLGLGAKLGNGRQVFPWVTRDEIVRVVRLALDREDVRGPVNVVGKEKVSNEEFVDTVARVLKRPRALRVPAFAMSMLGDFGQEMLTGAWVVPQKLEAAGYDWLDPGLEGALRRMLDR